MSSGPCGRKHARTKFAYLHEYYYAIKNIKTPHVLSVSVANNYSLLYIVSFFFLSLSPYGSVYTMDSRGSNNERKELKVGA